MHIGMSAARAWLIRRLAGNAQVLLNIDGVALEGSLTEPGHPPVLMHGCRVSDPRATDEPKRLRRALEALARAVQPFAAFGADSRSGSPSDRLSSAFYDVACPALGWQCGRDAAAPRAAE